MEGLIFGILWYVLTKIIVIVVSVLQLEAIDSNKKLQNFKARYLQKKNISSYCFSSAARDYHVRDLTFKWKLRKHV